MQTCVGSVAGMAFSGGFGSYLIAMDQQSFENVGNVVGNNSWVRLCLTRLQAIESSRRILVTRAWSAKCPAMS